MLLLPGSQLLRAEIGGVPIPGRITADHYPRLHDASEVEQTPRFELYPTWRAVLGSATSPRLTTPEVSELMANDARVGQRPLTWREGTWGVPPGVAESDACADASGPLTRGRRADVR